MTTALLEEVEEFIKKLGDEPFYTLRQLTSLGFFGTMASARKALKEGRITFITLSPRRRVIPRKAVLDYVQKNVSKQRVRKN